MSDATGEYSKIHVPARSIGSAPQVLNLGDRFITLQQVGSAHSPGDVTVHAGRVLFAGDVIEQGGPPNFADSRPRQWLRFLDELVAEEASDTLFVPGHGGTVDRDFVRRQAQQLREAIASCHDIAALHLPVQAPNDEALSALPYGNVESRFLYERLMATAP